MSSPKSILFENISKPPGLFFQLSCTTDHSFNIVRQKEHNQYTVKIQQLAKKRGCSNPKGFANFCSAKERYSIKSFYEGIDNSMERYHKELVSFLRGKSSLDVSVNKSNLHPKL